MTEKTDTRNTELIRQLKFVKKSLAKNPLNLNLLFQKGLVLYQLQKHEKAKDAFSKTIKVKPNFADGFNARSIVNHALGKFNEAIYDSEQALSINPRYKEALLNLARAQQELNQHDEAIENYTKAISLDQKYFKGFLGRAVIWKILEQHEKALADLNKAVSLDPSSTTALLNRGVVQKDLGRLDEALADLQKAIVLQPDFAEAHNNLGIALHELGRLNEAEASYKQAIALKPDFAEAHSNLGNTLKKQRRLDEAEASYTQARALKPDFAEAHSNLGSILQELGRFGKAEANYKQAIALKPDFAEAHRHLASLKNFDAKDEQYSKMLELYLDKNISEEQRCHINFGLAKACQDLKDFEQAFVHYSEGNVLRKKLLNYDIKQDVELFRQIKFNYPRIEQNSLAPDKLSKNLIPVFIVGMPRSGTTLVEQIISSHSQVTGAGELPFAAQFGAAIATGFSEASDTALLDFHNKYLDKLKNISNGNLIVTDKMPQNFRYIGLLAAAFPEAKIVHVKRDPAAVCWANYKQYFVSKSIGYCYAIDDVISYHKLYKNLMDFWTTSLGSRIYQLDYERLTVNQESETQQLIDYLDLDWDDKCLLPQDNTRGVATASNLQVREKVYQGSSEQWKKYKAFLNGAFDQFLA